ncbi:MAG: hypothetical protein AMJ81_03550 [Phycisphaerae bacterium SM23_33]|jgi:RNA polymerase sigma factor (sigma-70 family)|nr:MAG: hypothetical protein AMJ81_03550 [Phycisphaerae bacterium SM23_33]
MDPNPTEGPQAELSGQTDADLLAHMAMAGEDPGAARAAWEVFYRRHVAYLYGVCLRAYGALLGGPAGAADLTADAFRLAYENADKFDPAGIADPERLRLRARAWLGWIARRLVQETLRGRRRVPTKSLRLDHWQQVPAADRPERAPSPDERLVHQALASLNEREQLVIRTTFQWYRPEKRHQRLPNEVAAELARTLGTTPENLRQLRRRALRKIAEFVRGQAGPRMKETTDAQETPRQAPRRRRG